MIKKVDVLAIGAHPDDIELSAGGTLIKCVQEGKKVAIVDLTQGELGSRGTIETRFQEAADATKIMGISYRENLKLQDGFFEINKESLLAVIRAIRTYQPEIVLANAVRDRHPDHQMGSNLVSKACFLAGLLKIETQRNGISQEKWRPKAVYHYIQDRYIKPDFIVDVSPYFQEKMDAIMAYKTQFYQKGMKGPQTPISGKEFMESIKARLVQFGREIGVEYGEGFTTERSIGVDDITKLL